MEDESHAFVFTVKLITNYLCTSDLRRACSSPQGPQTRTILCPKAENTFSKEYGIPGESNVYLGRTEKETFYA